MRQGTGAIVAGAARGTIGAMAMSGLRQATTSLDLLGRTPPESLLMRATPDLFHRVPLLLTPTVAGQVGPPEGNGTIDGEETPNWVAFTYPFNMTRSPAGTVCAGFTSSGMPVGLQVVGPQHADVAVLRLLALLEDTFALDPVAPI